MKKLISIILCIILSAYALVITGSAAEAVFDVTQAIIVVDENASITDNYAAERLKYYLDEITGGGLFGGAGGKGVWSRQIRQMILPSFEGISTHG